MAEPAITNVEPPLTEEEEVEIAEKLDALLTEVRSSRNEITEVKEQLKADISEVKADIKDVKAELKADITEVKAEIKEVKVELKAEISEVKQELKADIKEVKQEVAAVEQRVTAYVNKRVDDGVKAVNTRIDDLRQEIHAGRIFKTSWHGVAIAAAATTAVIGTFLLQLMEAIL